MSSLFPPRASPTHSRPRASSHGGLGGLVRPEDVAMNRYYADSESLSWPNRGTTRPPPLCITYGNDNLLIPPAPWSAKSYSSYNSWTSKTPSSSDGGRPTATRGFQKSPLVSRFNPGGQLRTPVSHPVTPVKISLPLSAPPVELPGSLLLPSQGFAPPPATPPRPIKLQRRGTDESDLSSLPSLAHSVSTESSSDSMDLFRGLSHPHWKANGLTTNANGNHKSSGVSKPFSAMTMEELLSSLCACDSTTVARVWLPEMQRRCIQLKEVIQKSENTKQQSDSNLMEVGNVSELLESLSQPLIRDQDLKTFMQEARAISNTYECALRSAESLIERDTLNLQERLHLTESESKQVRAQSRASAAVLLKKDERIDALYQTLNHIVRTLGPYIERNAARWGEVAHDPDTEYVLQMVTDFGDFSQKSQDQYVRIQESAHLDLLTRVHLATAEVEKYRSIAQDQDTLIKTQSKQLDQQLDKYEESFKTIKSRDHEVMLLCQRNTELEEKVESYEVALQRNHAALTERDQFRQDNELLREELSQLRSQCRHQLEDKDNTISDLQQKLGSAREEILARQADVRNVITQTQAMLVAPGQTRNETTGSNNTPIRSSRGIGRNKGNDKKRTFLPSSQSSMFLGFQHINPDLMTTPNSNPNSKYSNKEVVGCDKRKFHTSCGSSSSSARTASTTPSQRRPSDDPFGGAGTHVRPRLESIGALGRDGVQYHPPSNSQKQLPMPPALLPRLPSSTLLNPNPFDTSSPPPMATTSSPQTSPRSSSPYLPPQYKPQPHSHNPSLPPSQPLNYDTSTSPPQPTSSLPTRSPARRVLSLIPEASVEDSESPRAPSASSSDREVYRRSIYALDLLNSNVGEKMVIEEEEGELSLGGRDGVSGTVMGMRGGHGDQIGMQSESGRNNSSNAVREGTGIGAVMTHANTNGSKETTTQSRSKQGETNGRDEAEVDLNKSSSQTSLSSGEVMTVSQMYHGVMSGK